jgi:hypothetical protein
MPSGSGERYDFFLSRRGSVAFASITQEVGNALVLSLSAATTMPIASRA